MEKNTFIHQFETCADTSSLWQAYVDKMRVRGFNGPIVYAFTYGLISRTGDLPLNQGSFNANKLNYMIALKEDVEEYNQRLLRNNLIEKDPLAYHARTFGTVALIGVDFCHPTQENYDDTLEYFNTLANFNMRNSLCVPVQNEFDWQLEGFGLHSTIKGSEFSKLIEKNYTQIMFDNYEFSRRFRRLYRYEYADKVKLTRKQMQVVYQLCQGRSNQEIAGEMGISQAAVSAHFKALQTKLGVSSTREIPVIALKLGYVSF